MNGIDSRSVCSIGYYSPGWPRDVYPNGIVAYVATMAEQLRAWGHRATVIAGAVGPGAQEEFVYGLAENRLARTLTERAVEGLARRLAPAWEHNRAFRRKLSGTARRAMTEQGIELLETEESFGIGRWLQEDLPIPICVRLHGPWFLNGVATGAVQDKAFDRRVDLEGELIRNAAAITSPSRDTLERTRAYYGLALERAQVIPNSTPPVPENERWNLEGSDPNQVLFVGRFDRHKGGDLMIDAFAQVLNAIPTARLSFVGPDRGLIDDQGRHWNLEGYVRERIPGAIDSGSVALLGHQPHARIAGLRRAALVTVACSRYENFPFTVVEAKALGCPIVAADVGGIPEIIEHGTDGLLHRGEDIGDLAAKIVAMLTSPDEAARLGRQAGNRCESFYPGAVATRSLEYYGQWLGRSSVLSSAEG